jgi:hypothetical protein
MAPPVDHFQVRRRAQLLVPMLDDAVLQPGLSGRQAKEDIVVDPELGSDPAAAGLGRDPVAPALWHQLRHSSREIASEELLDHRGMSRLRQEPQSQTR